MDDGEVAGLELRAHAFGCEGGGKFGRRAGEGGANVLVFEGEGEAVACAVAGCAEEGEGFGWGHGGGLVRGFPGDGVFVIGRVDKSRLQYWKLREM